MATRALHNNGSKGMVVMGGGNVGSNITNLSMANTSTVTDNTLGQSNTISVVKGNAVTTTSILQSSTTGYVKITKSSHGLTVGQRIMVYGSNISGYNRIHTVTVVLSSSTVQTDIAYTADTTTHGFYRTISSNVANMTDGTYVGQMVHSSLMSPGADRARASSYPARGNNRYDVTYWNAVTGAAVRGTNAGATFTYKDMEGNALAVEPMPTKSVPGEFVYKIGATPTMGDYNPTT